MEGKENGDRPPTIFDLKVALTAVGRNVKPKGGVGIEGRFCDTRGVDVS